MVYRCRTYRSGCADGHTVIIYGLTHNADGNSSNITVTIDMEYEKLRFNVSKSFYVDEYGNLSY